MKPLRSGAIVFLLSLLCLQAASAAPVGRVIMSVGEVTALRQGKSVPLGLGAEVEDGDRVRTGQASNAQIRFTDSAIVALRPDSDFSIDQYVFSGKQDGSERAIFRLFKGGLRTITGLIGKANQRSYAVRTPTATVGVRGTHFNLVHCDNDCKNNDGSTAPNGTYGGVSDGRIGVTPLNAAPALAQGSVAGRQYAAAGSAGNGGVLDVMPVVDAQPREASFLLAQAGGSGGGGGSSAAERVFGAGEFFRVPDANTPAVQLLAPPGFLTDKLEGQVRARQGGTATAAATPSAAVSSSSASSGSEVDARAVAPVAAPVPLQFTTPEAISSSGGSSVLVTGIRGFIAEYSHGGSLFVVEDCPDVTCSGPALQAKSFSFEGNNLTSWTGSNTSGSLGGGSVVDTGVVTIAGSQYGWGRWVGNFSVTDSGGTFNGTTAKSGVLFGFGNDPTINTQESHIPTSGTVNYVLAGGPSPVDTQGNTGTMNSMTGTANFLTRATSVNMNMTFNIPSQGTATISASGGGTMSVNSDHLSAASLSASCSGAGCASPSASGGIDVRFAGSGAPVMVVNGAVNHVLKDSALGASSPQNALFLNILKCNPGC